MRAYFDRIRQARRLARSRPAEPTRHRTWSVYAFTILYLSAWALLAPARNLGHFHAEGAPIDWLSSIYLMTGGMLAAIAWWVGERKDHPGSWFWLVCGFGLTFLALDERLQWHEHGLSTLLKTQFGEPPVGRNWNDLVVIGYGVVGAALFVTVLPVVLRYRGVLRLLVAGGVLFVLHTALDAMRDIFEVRAYEEMLEEACKLLASASFMLAFLQAALCRAAEAPPDTDPAGRRRPFRLFGVFLYALTALLAVEFLDVAAEGYRDLCRHWGEPVLWLASAYLAGAALLSWFSGIPLGDARRRRFGLGIAALLAALALDEATAACRTTFLGSVAFDVLPRWMTDGVTMLHPPNAAGVTLLAVALLLGILAVRREPETAPLLVIGLLVIVASMVVPLALPAWGLVPARAALVLGAATVLLAAGLRFAGTLPRTGTE